MLNDIVQRGQQARERAQAVKREAEEKARAERAVKENEIGLAFLEAHGIDEAALKALSPEYHEGYGKGIITLHYLDLEASVEVTRQRTPGAFVQRGVVQSDYTSEYDFRWPGPYQADTLSESLGLFVLAAQERRDEKRADVLKALRDETSRLDYRFHARRYTVPDSLWGDPDIIEARVQLLVAERPVWDNTTEWHVSQWLLCAEEVIDTHIDDLRAGVLELRERLARYETLKIELNQLACLPVTDGDVTRAESLVAEYGFSGDEATQAALTKMRAMRDERAAAKSAEAEAARNLEAAQADAWYPFRIFEIGYGVVATDGDGAQYVDVRSFYSVSEQPGEDSFWTDVAGERVRPAHVVWTKIHEFRTLKSTPREIGCGVETIHGTVWGPPRGAVALED